MGGSPCALHKHYPGGSLEQSEEGPFLHPSRGGRGGEGAVAKVSVLRAACSLGLGKACKASPRTEGHGRAREKGESADPHARPRKVGQRRLAPEAQRTNALPGRGGS